MSDDTAPPLPALTFWQPWASMILAGHARRHIAGDLEHLVIRMLAGRGAVRQHLGGRRLVSQQLAKDLELVIGPTARRTW
jgi:hypothetical protein